MKKTILVVWPVHREDWLLPFKKLSEDYNFVFLAGIAEAEINFAEAIGECIYWSEFANIDEILADIQPSKIVFMSLDSGLNIALNYKAKLNRIETYLLQHGIYTNYKDYRIREKFWKKQDLATKNLTNKKSVGFKTVNFINSSFTGFQKRLILLIFIYSKAIQKKGPYWAARHIQFSQRKPEKYICFSPYNSTIHRELDRVGDDKFEYFGSIELDNYLTEQDKGIDEEFYLHIDQAFAENSFGEETVSKDQMIDFYKKLNAYCLKKGVKLYIKLHPESYNSAWLPVDSNIIYLRKVDNFNMYIQSALGCFGFYSTMIIPAVYWKPVVLFNIFYSGLQDKLKSFDNVKIISFNNFQISDIEFDDAKTDRCKLVKEFFLKDDGQSLLRLKSVLDG